MVANISMKISNDDIKINMEMPNIPKVSETSADFDNYSHDPFLDKRKDSDSNKTLELKEKIKVGEYDIDIDKLSSILLNNL